MAEVSGSLLKAASTIAVTARRHIYPQHYQQFCGNPKQRDPSHVVLLGMIISAEILRNELEMSTMKCSSCHSLNYSLRLPAVRVVHRKNIVNSEGLELVLLLCS